MQTVEPNFWGLLEQYTTLMVWFSDQNQLGSVKSEPEGGLNQTTKHSKSTLLTGVLIVGEIISELPKWTRQPKYSRRHHQIIGNLE